MGEARALIMADRRILTIMVKSDHIVNIHPSRYVWNKEPSCCPICTPR